MLTVYRPAIYMSSNLAVKFFYFYAELKVAIQFLIYESTT